MLSIDLNCDMGEGMDNDALLMPLITSANIACGGHAGDASTMKKTVELAIQYHVAIGAHPGFVDKLNFGRTEMNLTLKEVYDLVTTQVKTLQIHCSACNTPLHHVKPHGALYNMAAKNEAMARAIAQAVYDIDTRLILYGLSGSYLIAAAKNVGLKTAAEVFADRTYQNDGSLTPRSQSNALITDMEQSVKQVLQMIQHQKVTAIDGQEILLTADTLCLHGDGQHAVEFAVAIHQQLRQHPIELKAL